MNYDYLIAGLCVRITGEKLEDHKNTAPFRVYDREKADVMYQSSMTEELPLCQGEELLRVLHTVAYLDGKYLQQVHLDQVDGHAVALCRYPVDKQENIQLWLRREDESFVRGIDRLFPVMDLTYQLLKCGVVTLHCAAIETPQGAILFAAPSGTGKSTQAALWEKYRGSRVVNGDKAAIRMTEGVPYAYGLPFCGTSGICENFALPLRAIVLLSQAPENTVRRLGLMEAVGGVMKNAFGHPEVPGCMNKILNVVLDVAAQAPVYHLACTPDESAVAALEQALGKEQ